jgi:leucyl/phenylalanyl-tRNA---protein transferase
MPLVCYSDTDFHFPPLHQADEEGLLVIGGAVSPKRVLEAYPKGIFPWYSDAIPLWWSPDPRFVLFPDELHVSRSMKKLLLKNVFDFRVNTAFPAVIEACATVPRDGQDGTWITAEMKTVYSELHHLGFAHSAEAWLHNKLVGGMYGIRLGNVFFGESMFSTVTNASKFAFIRFVQQLSQEDVALIDCQVYTTHVESLGGRLIGRKAFTDLLRQHC